MPWKKDANGNWANVTDDAPAAPKKADAPTAELPSPSVEKAVATNVNATKATLAKVTTPNTAAVKVSAPKPAPKATTPKATEVNAPALKPITTKVSVLKEVAPKVATHKTPALRALSPKAAATKPTTSTALATKSAIELPPKPQTGKVQAKKSTAPKAVAFKAPAVQVPKVQAEKAQSEKMPAQAAKDLPLPPPSDPFDDISFDGTYLTSATTEEVYNARSGTVEEKRVNGSGRSNNNHYYSHGAGNPAAYNEDEEDARSMSSMSMLFRKARGGRYNEPQQSTDYANYQIDDDATVDSLSSIFGKMKSSFKAPSAKETFLGAVCDDDNDDALDGIIGDVANLHDTGKNDKIDSIEPEVDESYMSAYNLADVSRLQDPEEQPEHDAEKIVDVPLEEKPTTDLTSYGSKDDAASSGRSFSTSSSLRRKEKKKKCGKSNSNMCIVISTLLVLAIIAAISFFQIYYKKGRNSVVDVSSNKDLPRLRVPTQAPLKPGETYAPTITSYPTYSPTLAPAERSTSGPGRTNAPTVNYIDPLMEFLQDNQVYFERDPLSPDFMAVQWLADEAQIRSGDDGISSEFGNGLDLSKKTIQRFALLTLDFALLRPEAPYATKLARNSLAHAAMHAEYTELELETYARSNTIAVKYQDECHWVGVTCAEVGPLAGEVIEINFSHSGLAGTIPPEIRLLKNLKRLHMAGNNIKGSIPDSLFNIRGLEHIYLYQNRLTGTIPKNIGNLWNMTRLHLSHNELSGSIPLTFKSTADEIRPIEYLNLYSNKFTGTIPHDLRWRNIKYADLGRNKFSGTLPDDIGERWVELRFLHLDNNEFTGTVPDSYPTTGNGRVEAMTLNHNNLEGEMPGGFELNKLLEFNVQDNMFTGIDKKACKQSVFISGELVEYKADCDICDCDPYCELKCGTPTEK